jgi:hypothetical protein
MLKDLTIVRKRLPASTRRAMGEATMCKAEGLSRWPATVGFSATCVHLHFSRKASIVGEVAWKPSSQAGMTHAMRNEFDL